MEFWLILFIVLAIIVLIGHGVWVFLAFIIRALLGKSSPAPPPPTIYQTDKPQLTLKDELRVTARKLQDLRNAGEIDERAFRTVADALQRQMQPLAPRWKQADTQPVPKVAPPTVVKPPVAPPAPAPTALEEVIRAPARSAPAYLSVTAQRDATDVLPLPEPDAPPRRSWSEALASFMEEGNIRWGEIVGGLLIVGCSTALVVSLWSRISQVPALKFFIFTAVTAAIFGIGLYTAHRWKLPTTSYGILTIATLLVPLNFLAMAAVSGEGAALIAVSELFAPALFLFLVYRAGCVLTPGWRWLLALSVLGSSVGQLLVRHLAGPGAALPLLYVLGAFPLVGYLWATGVMLRRADADEAVTEDETVPIFITLGVTTFAAVLPFGLLLYKSGAAAETLMRLAPLLALFAVPLLACGLLLWRRIDDTELAAERTAGTSLALFGAFVAAASLFIAWPNPFSVVVAALALFGIATTTARFFRLPHAHTFAAACLALAYAVAVQAFAGRVAWQVAPGFNLFWILNDISAGQVLAVLVVAYVVAAEWWRKSEIEHLKPEISDSYLLVAGLVAAISFVLVTAYGLRLESDPHGVAFIYALYAGLAAFMAWRQRLTALTWIASGLALMAATQLLTAHLNAASPWQAAMLTTATLATGGALFARARGAEAQRIFTQPLFYVALVCAGAAACVFVQAWDWQTVGLVAFRLYWLAGIALALLWLSRREWLFDIFQILLTAAVLVSVKWLLRHSAWYAALPHATLHPWSLQIHGTALLLLSLGWLALRYKLFVVPPSGGDAVDGEPAPLFGVSSGAEAEAAETVPPKGGTTNGWPADMNWRGVAAQFLEPARFSFDRLFLPAVLAGLILLSLYGAWTGVKLELARQGVISHAFNLGGFAHEHALEIGSWTVLGLLVIALLANLRESAKRGAENARLYFLGVIVALWCGVPLLAGLWEKQYATASALRWLSALFLLATAVIVWQRDRLAAALPQFPASINPQSAIRIPQFLSLAPLLLLTVFPLWRAMWYAAPRGPARGVFQWLGAPVSYSLPLGLAALALVVMAARQRSARAAFGAAWLAALAVNAAHVMALASAGALMDRVALARAAQLSAVTAACAALLWLATRDKWRPEASSSERFLRWLLGFAIAVNAALLVPVFLRIFTQPTWKSSGTAQAGSPLGWLALILTSAAVLWFGKVYRFTINAYAILATLWAVGILVAGDVARLDTNKQWFAYHALMFAAVAAMYAMIWLRELFVVPPLGGWLRALSPKGGTTNDFLRCAWLCAGAALLLAVRGLPDDPLRPWWAVGALAATALLFVELNWQTLRRGYLYAAGALLWLAINISYFTGLNFWKTADSWVVFSLLAWNALLIALSGVAWLLLELRAQLITGSDVNRSAVPTPHSVAMSFSVGLLALLNVIGLAMDFDGVPAKTPYLLVWAAFGAAVLLAAGCLKERGATYPVFALYYLGLIGLGLLIDFTNFTAAHLWWVSLMALAGYALATSLVWRRRVEIQAAWARWHIPPRRNVPDGENIWLRGLNLTLALGAALGLLAVALFYANDAQRGLSAVAVGAQVFTFGLLSRGAHRLRWQKVALAFLAAGVVYAGWAWLGPAATWLDRAVALMLALLATLAALAAGPRKVAQDWTDAAQRVMPALTVICLAALAFVLGDEVQQQANLGYVNTNTPTLLTVAVTLLAACAMAVVVALRGEFDPLKLPERGRMAYVYAAEILLALLFMHVRLTLPWLFGGRLEKYWPYVVVVLAYAGVALSEALKRRRVLAEPLERTGVFLPLIPVIGFWMVNSQARYSWVMFAVGGLYGGLALLRKSWGFGVLAAIAAHGGFWRSLAHTDGLRFGEHPQLWLIPAALCVLAGAHLNRERFTEEQMTAVRYGALSVIYVSSTADIYLNGVAEAPWLPLILAALAIAGVFLGILLRIRAFLWLGVTFLLVAVGVMNYYASSNLGWTWIWWVSGILAGAAIIFVFALFEKKKTEMLQMVDDLRAWES